MFVTSRRLKLEIERQNGIRNAAIHALAAAIGVAVSATNDAEGIIQTLKSLVANEVRGVDPPVANKQEYRDTLSIVLQSIISSAERMKDGPR